VELNQRSGKSCAQRAATLGQSVFLSERGAPMLYCAAEVTRRGGYSFRAGGLRLHPEWRLHRCAVTLTLPPSRQGHPDERCVRKGLNGNGRELRR
jgi:hypothetical protein